MKGNRGVEVYTVRDLCTGWKCDQLHAPVALTYVPIDSILLFPNMAEMNSGQYG
jgi:hypothetical protein